MGSKYPIWSIVGALMILVAIGYGIYVFWNFVLYVIAAIIILDFLVYWITGDPLLMGRPKK